MMPLRYEHLLPIALAVIYVYYLVTASSFVRGVFYGILSAVAYYELPPIFGVYVRGPLDRYVERAVRCIRMAPRPPPPPCAVNPLEEQE